MQDAVTNEVVRPIGGEGIEITMDPSAFRAALNIYQEALEEPSDSENAARTAYLRGMDRDSSPPIITGTAGEIDRDIITAWAERELESLRARSPIIRDSWDPWSAGPYVSIDEMRPAVSVVEQIHPMQEAYNESVNRIADSYRPHVRMRRADLIHDDGEEELEALAARVEQFEQTQEQQKKRMEATKERKSIYKHRFSDAPWFEWLKKREIIVLGAGGIGSWVSLCLARVGCILHIYDMDTIEAHNLGGQFYNMHQVGQNKAEATSALSRDFSGGESEVYTYGRFDEESPIGPIVISCFDNMAGRQLAFSKWSEALASDPENAADYLFIDGRLLAEDYQVYATTAGRLDAYRGTLFADGEVQDAHCSLKATTHCAMGIASDMVGQLANFATNRAYGEDIREVPFSIIKCMPLFTYDLNLEGDEQPKESSTEADAVPAL